MTAKILQVKVGGCLAKLADFFLTSNFDLRYFAALDKNEFLVIGLEPPKGFLKFISNSLKLRGTPEDL